MVVDITLCIAQDVAMTNAASDLLTSSEAAQRLHIDTSTLSRWTRAGRISEFVKAPGLRGPRWFEAAEVQRLVDEMRRRP